MSKWKCDSAAENNLLQRASSDVWNSKSYRKTSFSSKKLESQHECRIWEKFADYKRQKKKEVSWWHGQAYNRNGCAETNHGVCFKSFAEKWAEMLFDGMH